MDNDPTGDLTATKKNVAELYTRNLVLESEIKVANAARDEAVLQLKEANDLIEADTKCRLVEQCLTVTTMSLSDLAGKDIDDLETILSVSAMTKRAPRVFESGADLGLKGVDGAPFNPRTHLHDLYIGNKRRG